MKLPNKKTIARYLITDSFCPWCGTDNISICEPQTDTAIAWADVNCKDCGMEWQDEYTLTGISILTNSGDRIHSNGN